MAGMVKEGIVRWCYRIAVGVSEAVSCMYVAGGRRVLGVGYMGCTVALSTYRQIKDLVDKYDLVVTTATRKGDISVKESIKHVEDISAFVGGT
jgi:hypothetical protein